ncbi:Na+/H+ antiporter subunit E [Chlorobaculum sp. MV4-Y]|uniref:Na+/H+ antiporter subunit E n=1 Tax=Chlorobaculum sp. MV4-Y TaxID=2976335 RepID=UPI0021B01B84|nr:Na+/H+ antiporter subunit E [Chlorobaculum sp. MV4-Y]UWX57740.1 Na+/H+ antiporter subunit E [Chlorobaculum sp. MV4-Y]
MSQFLFNILLAFACMLLTGESSAPSFISGMVVGYLILWMSRSAFGKDVYFSKIPRLTGFLLYFLKELILANLRVAFDILTPKNYLEPGIVEVPLDVKSDLEITLFANLVTLTPGTLSLDVSADRKILYVHVMYLQDEEHFMCELKEGLEKRLIEVMR